MDNTVQTIDKLKEVFQPIADKIGQGAQFGWEVVVRQQYVEAFGSFLQFLCGIAFAYITYRIFKYGFEKAKNDKYSDWSMNVWLVLFFGIPVSLILMSGLYDAIAHVINPNYYAIKFFIDLVK